MLDQTDDPSETGHTLLSGYIHHYACSVEKMFFSDISIDFEEMFPRQLITAVGLYELYSILSVA